MAVISYNDQLRYLLSNVECVLAFDTAADFLGLTYGWYRYDTRFALPVYMENGELERYNVFCVEMMIRCAADVKLYLYDLVNIKKETSTPLER